MRDLDDGTPPAGQGRALFLQGPPSIFWWELAQSLERAGWTVDKIHLAPSDLLFWRGAKAQRFAGDKPAWRAHLAAYLRDQAPNAVMLYADRLPYHKVAISLCKALGIPVYVIENGYLRPDWLTCEVGGMGRYSRIPKKPGAIRAAAVDAPEPDLSTRYSHRFFNEAWREVAFHLTNGLTPKSIWRFDSERYYHPVYDYLHYVWKMTRSGSIDRATRRVCEDLLMKERPFYFAPLQMQSDYSVRDNSDFGHISEMIKKVIVSFARHAPPKSRLLFKTHPHDNGAENFPRHIRRFARKQKVGRRVHVIESGPFGTLTSASKGVVVINSTSGLHGLRAMKPVIALGDAVYDVPGLTHQGGLDRFWRKPDRIDQDLLNDFVRLLAHRFQVKGSFFNPEGRREAIETITERVTGKSVDALDMALANLGGPIAGGLGEPEWRLAASNG